MIVLDEPTAPLDPASETSLIATLREIAKKKIVLIVAHRATTLAACDRVFFIHDRAVSASGSHLDLIRSCAPYRAYLAAS